MRNAWQMERVAAPAEFAGMLAALEITQAACGRYLGVSDRTVRRYVAGETAIPPAHVLLMRALVHFRIRPLVPRARRAG